MSEEALARIEHHLTQLQTEVRTGVAEVRSDIARVDHTMHALHDVALERIEEVDRTMHVLHNAAMERVAEVDRNMHVLHDTAIERIGQVDQTVHVLHDAAMERIGDVNGRMHVLHEEAMATIRGIAEHDLVIEPVLNTRLAAMQEPLERGLDVLEAMAQQEPSGNG